jgi:phosphoglycerol transferase MdoB-like AlkP superfamily enzyme
LKDEFINNNEAMMAHTLADAHKSNSQPAFTYVHLMMPHAPFVFDSTGRHTYQAQNTAENYLQYLVYTDKRITRFIKELKQATKGQAVIILMGDHGVRLKISNSVLPAYQALNAIYLPEKQYTGWYPGITHVNQFRILFNTIFQQHMPLLPDTLVTH